MIVQKQLLAFLLDASRPSFGNGWYQLELLIAVKGHSEECGAFVENATQLLIYVGTDKKDDSCKGRSRIYLRMVHH